MSEWAGDNLLISDPGRAFRELLSFDKSMYSFSKVEKYLQNLRPFLISAFKNRNPPVKISTAQPCKLLEGMYCSAIVSIPKDNTKVYYNKVLLYIISIIWKSTNYREWNFSIIVS